MKLTRKARVKNALGLHARPATAIIKLLEGAQSSVFFTLRKETINARSIMGILLLAASKNSLIQIDVEGEDAEQIMEKILSAFEDKFGDEQ